MLRSRGLEGLRVLVVGASSGIGREIALQLVGRHSRVAVAARRTDRLANLVGATPIACDVRDPLQCEQLVARSAAGLGGLDAVVYATALSKITPVDTADIDEWRAVFETNVFGAVLVTKFAIPHLTADGSAGRAVFLSSDSSDVAFPGLGAYSASKAALGRFCQGLSDELPAVSATEVVVGPTTGTDIADGFDPEIFSIWATRWFEEGFVRHAMQQPADVARVVLALLEDPSPARRVFAVGAAEVTASLEEGRRQAEAKAP
jgi:NAD(P)-dependent dehydrogenase (short-subunit alcohol dehydrogenase family)